VATDCGAWLLLLLLLLLLLDESAVEKFKTRQPINANATGSWRLWVE
jgi:hypothetical protein